MKHIDLNLLRVLQVLYEERSALRAGDRLGVTQSAISHALGRLREYFDDPLFVRGQGGLQPTPRTMEIAPTLTEVFARIQDVLAPITFDPATTRREFTIAASLFLCELLLPTAIARARAVAPFAKFRLWNARDVANSLDEGKVDIALGSFERTPARFRSQALLEDEFVWVAGADMALPDGPISLDRIAAMPRVVVAAREDYRGVDGRILDVGLQRQVISGSDEALEGAGFKQVAPAQIAVFDAHIAIAMVRASPVIASVPRLLAVAHTGSRGIKILDTPGPLPRFAISAIWRQDAEEDPALKWLRRMLVEFAARDADQSAGVAP